jgi:hypothetical protein
MGNTSSTPFTATNTSLPQTPASSFFNLTNPQPPRQRIRKPLPPPPVAYQRRSIFQEDEDEPDDFCTNTPHEAVLLGWTRTEQGFVIPQIRSIPFATPLDDTIFNSPRLPWVERSRSRSPVPSARSIPRMRQFSIESLRSCARRELRVVNTSRPNSVKSMERMSEETDVEGADDNDSDAGSFDWQAFPDPIDEFQDYEGETHCLSSSLKRGNSTNDSGYSTMAGDTGSCSSVSEDPWWWEEAAGYSTTSLDLPASSILTSEDGGQYLHEERQESAYLSNLLRSQPFDEWTEWRTNVTKLLMIPEEEEMQQRPTTPINQKEKPPAPRSPSRRKSLFSFAKVTTNIVLNKRRSVIW